jgi:hypothetical protein
VVRERTLKNVSFAHLTTGDSEILSVTRNREGWTLIEAAVDSGAMDNVMPITMLPAVALHESPGSKRRASFRVANGAKIPNLGQKVVKFQTQKGQDRQIIFQVASVTRALISVGKIKQAGHDVILDTKPRIVDHKTGEVTMLVEKGGLHVLEMWVKKVTKVVRRTVSPQHTDLGPLDCHAASGEEGRELEDREMGVRRGACRRRGAREPRGLRTGGDPGRLYSERWSDAQARRNADQLQAYMTYWAVRWTHCREL